MVVDNFPNNLIKATSSLLHCINKLIILTVIYHLRLPTPFKKIVVFFTDLIIVVDTLGWIIVFDLKNIVEFIVAYSAWTCFSRKLKNVRWKVSCCRNYKLVVCCTNPLRIKEYNNIVTYNSKRFRLNVRKTVFYTLLWYYEF